ncbi:hypothetical protein ACFL18_01795 [Patescibacteria group bacterium]
MAVAAYSTDLADVQLGTGTWVELTGATAGSAPTEGDVDNYIAGTYSTTGAVRNSGLSSVATPSLGGTTVTSGDAIFMWYYFASMPVIEPFADGGMRIAIGSGIADYTYWTVAGFDTLPYGGWVNYAIDPEDPATTGTDYGTPSGTINYIGGIVNMNDGISKGNALAVDYIREGRSLIMESGDSNAYANFSEASNYSDANDLSFTADTVDTDATLTNITDTTYFYPGMPISGTGIPATTYVSYVISSTSLEMTNAATATNTDEPLTSQPYNRFGLFTRIKGGFSQKGLFQMGSSGTAVDFRDSNKNIVIEDTLHVAAGFNEFEVLNASSNVDWTGIQVSALGTQSPGLFTVSANATVDLDGCTFNDMGTFTFMSNSTITDTTFRRCAALTQASSTITGCTIAGATTADGVAFITSDDLASISNCSFTFSDGHAIMLTSAHAASPTEHTFTGNTFTGYSGTPGSNLVESSGSNDAAIYNNSGKHLIINITGGVTSPSVRNGAGATTTINNYIDVTVTIKNPAGVVLPGVEVAIFQDNAARTPVLASTPTDEDGQVTTSVTASLGAIIIRARQSTDTLSFRTQEDAADGITAASDIINTLTNHNFQVGDAVVYSKGGGSAVIGLTDGNTYYTSDASPADANSVKLYTSAALAIADGTPVTLNADAADETHTLDPVRYVAGSASGTIGATAFSAEITMLTDTIATG